jgi:L-rhamnose mutarotase
VKWAFENSKLYVMKRVGSKMFLKKGIEQEYKKRHDEIWPELVQLLSDTGISEYSIFLDAETLVLFAYFKIHDTVALESLPSQPIMKKWWSHMKDIMETNPDNSPVNISLSEVFYLP